MMPCDVCGVQTNAVARPDDVQWLICEECQRLWHAGYMLLKCCTCNSYGAYPVKFHEEVVRKLKEKDAIIDILFTPEGFALLLLKECPECTHGHCGTC